MCGIIGFIGKRNCTTHLVDGLKNLEYRGYDSAGLAVLNNEKISVLKRIGKVVELEKALKKEKINSEIGIAHTRWATHGVVNEINAHPHSTDKLALVHNGIIENFEELKKPLKAKGYKFKSETDSETVAWLITDFLNEGNSIVDSIRKSLNKIVGSYALGIIFKEDSEHIYCAKKDSPLAIGYGDGEFYLGSDAIAMLNLTNKISYLENEDIGILGRDSVEIIDKKGKACKRKIQEVKVDNFNDLDGYETHMKKEIFEQPKVLKDTFDAFKPQMDIVLKTLKLKKISRITIVACGTAYHAGYIAKGMLGSLINFPIEIDVASEFRYRNPYFDKNTLAIFVSQSGETADTLSSLHYCKKHGVKTLSIVNVYHSSVARESDYVIYTKAGFEIGVASTKAFTTQVLALSLFMAHLAKAKDKKIDLDNIIKSIEKTPKLVQEVLKQEKEVAKIASKFSEINEAFYLGRGVSYPVALEGSLKLKEISYIHSQAYSAGEMKHGPIALIEENMPTVAVVKSDYLFEKMISNIKEIQSRKGPVIIINEKNKEDKIKTLMGKADYMISIPNCDQFQFPIVATIPLQLFAYHMAKLKGTDIDKPRNLAKSVTVE